MRMLLQLPGKPEVDVSADANKVKEESDEELEDETKDRCGEKE